MDNSASLPFPELRQRKATDESAFTLVELLVVIGIIAVLIALLLPVLSKAREAANRVVCLSNLRQVGLGFQMYAHESKGQVPIGYVVGQKQLNYAMWVGAPHNRLTLFGLISATKNMPDPRAWYCPSETLDTYRYNTSGNPWPPGLNPASNTRAGFGCRPVVDWPNGMTPPTLPRLNAVKNLAIFADLVSAVDRVNQRHKNGVNVLYGHGGAHWVPRSLFETELKNSPIVFPVTVPGKAAANLLQDDIWSILDQN